VSALAGCLRFDGAPADARTLVPLLAAAAHRAPGLHATWEAGPVALAHGGSRHETAPTQPFRDPATDTTLVFDGRLDNRDELIAGLACAPGLADPALVLAAYRRWGTLAAAWLLGDFAFAIWDARERRLFCARDVMGQRPLFYAQARGCFVVASEPQQVLAHPAVSRQIDEGIVAEELSGIQTTVSDTLWRDVKRLPPACALVAGGDGAVRITRYWDFDPEARLDLPGPEAYAQRLREVLSEAVRRRVANVRPAVGLFLSGGLDSSVLAGLAARQHEAGGPAVHALSLVYPGRACDESTQIAAVVSRWRLRAEQCDPTPPWRDIFETEIDRYRTTPTWPNGAVLQPLRARARQLGIEVVLTGYGGDEWLTGSVHHTADLLRAGELVAALRQLRVDGSGRRPSSRAALLRIAVAPLLPGWMKTVLKPVLGSARPRQNWIRPELAARVGLAARLRPTPAPAFRTFAQQHIYRLARGPAQVIGDELDERAAAADGLDARHPFYDRAVAEFGMALPEPQRRQGTETKHVLRRAFADLIPPPILARRDKAEFSSTYVDALTALGGASFFTGLRTERAGWVDGAVVRRRYDEMIRLYSRGDDAYIGSLNALWAVASVEMWARRLL
jgi:asparagine synthase (glutamine-hydrolysing)